MSAQNGGLHASHDDGENQHAKRKPLNLRRAMQLFLICVHNLIQVAVVDTQGATTRPFLLKSSIYMYI